MTQRSGRHFLQIPGPTNVPGSVLDAISQPTIDHRGPEFVELVRGLLPSLKAVFDTGNPVVIYPGSGTGAWEASLVNTLSPGDQVLACESGHFASLWSRLAGRLGLEVLRMEGSWRRGVDPAAVFEQLNADSSHQIRAVLVVHNETSTGAVTNIPEIRAAIDAADHPALLLVDAISSLGSLEYHHDDWGVDVTIAASQKGLMLPPGVSFNAVSDKAREASLTAGFQRGYWEWRPMIDANEDGMFPYTPATNLLFGLRQALDRLDAEGMSNVFARHQRHADAARAAVRAWGLELFCEDELAQSNVLTVVALPEEFNADEVRRIILERFDMSLGQGLGKLSGRVFRIGHLGDLNDLTLAGALCGVEMGLRLTGVRLTNSGIPAALSQLEIETAVAPV